MQVHVAIGALVGSTALLLSGCGAPSEPPEAEAPVAVREAADPHEGLDHKSVDACASCHADVVGQWKESMHARAHQDNDPIFAGMRTLRMKKQGEQVAEQCVRCHNPMAPDAPGSDAGKLGVACGACHGPDAVVPEAEADGLSLCMHCHDATKNPKDVAVCTTGPESREGGSAPCTACHMRASDGTVTHQFLGPHRAWYQSDPSFLASALSTQLKREGDQLTVTVVNTTGHAVPTGFPGRVAAIRLVGPDGAPGGKPLAAPEELTFLKRYVDDEGKPVLPPFSSKLDLDTRLKPGETRSVTVTVPESAGKVKAELVYRLVPPPAVTPLGLEGAKEAEPVAVELAVEE